jgi:hypothetical protein
MRNAPLPIGAAGVDTAACRTTVVSRRGPYRVAPARLPGGGGTIAARPEQVVPRGGERSLASRERPSGVAVTGFS